MRPRSKKLLGQVRDAVRRKRYSLLTEKAHVRRRFRDRAPAGEEETLDLVATEETVGMDSQYRGDIARNQGSLASSSPEREAGTPIPPTNQLARLRARRMPPFPRAGCQYGTIG